LSCRFSQKRDQLTRKGNAQTRLFIFAANIEAVNHAIMWRSSEPLEAKMREAKVSLAHNSTGPSGGWNIGYNPVRNAELATQ
jgi:hypothetical protein